MEYFTLAVRGHKKVFCVRGKEEEWNLGDKIRIREEYRMLKKYGIIYMLSFVFYFFVLEARPYISAQTWADILLLLFIFAIIYEITYLIFLRKKECVGFGRALARWFLYGFTALEVSLLKNYFDEILFATDLVHILVAPLFLLCVLYQIGYFTVSYFVRKKR